ncbi:MAG: hypothetical protein KKA42_15090, partial [candidate division Zixibacteria bacterium]|nr:hypothetical protein [candidate division Zixibacteria bacterium]
LAAVDFAGQVSELSAEFVPDTPRPDGENILFYNDLYANMSGFDFDSAKNVPDISPQADVWLDRGFVIDGLSGDTLDTIPYLNVGAGYVDIQDMGFRYDLDDVDVAPDTGWSVLGYVEVIEGHVYIVWTDDNHFAKMRAEEFEGGLGVRFAWAYQTDEGNIELSPPMVSKPSHGAEYGRPQPKDIWIHTNRGTTELR